MTTYPPVVAAIPNYNMGRHLRELIPQLLAQHYDAIFVLDDASTDDSVDVVAEFGDDVRFVRSPENRGAGANRNQIIDHVDSGTLIHFVDADMEMTTADTPAVAREIAGRYLRHGIGMIGGLVSRLDGSQEYCNYGAAFSLWGNFTSNVPRLVDHWRDKPRLAGAVQRVAGPIAPGWPRLLDEPIPRRAYWLHEGNLLVHSDVFALVGGYDPALRSHEAQDLAIRLDAKGIGRQFDPSIRVIHHHIDVRGKNRRKWESTATRYLIRKHGMARFVAGGRTPLRPQPLEPIA
ncbi:glycosyltransferase [Candidatus Mycobacterium wuenschmannii]|uniref:Glycosyltransferase n=1 Tax=Candidatus Mycobacterium wuenschmannii TaxID=3027808 RepID=A0ABY8VYK6_9MYCO|nr:glycosyltransferase family 2 protein [Candidatus Mycobacterium wuenschmannii]WIM88714.1 glycosyltransferase [Candidatus Mycobacterium wuenschmannii]